MTETAFESHKWSKNDYVVSEFGEQLFNQAASFFGYQYGNSPMVNDLRNSGSRKQRVYGANYREHTLKLWDEKKQEFKWVSCKGYRLAY